MKKFNINLLNSYTSHVTYIDQLVIINWFPILMNIFHRRFIADLIMTLNILKVIVDIDKSSVFQVYSTSNLGPIIKIRKDNCITKATVNYFFTRVSRYYLEFVPT